MVNLDSTDTPYQRATKAWQAIAGTGTTEDRIKKLAEIFEKYRDLDRPEPTLEQAVNEAFDPADPVNALAAG